MLHRGIWCVAMIAALIMLAVGAGSASASGLRIHAGQIGGVVRPVANTGAVHASGPTFELFGASGSGSPSPDVPLAHHRCSTGADS